jgi:hypothetical protein
MPDTIIGWWSDKQREESKIWYVYTLANGDKVNVTSVISASGIYAQKYNDMKCIGVLGKYIETRND